MQLCQTHVRCITASRAAIFQKPDEDTPSKTSPCEQQFSLTLIRHIPIYQSHPEKATVALRHAEHADVTRVTEKCKHLDHNKYSNRSCCGFFWHLLPFVTHALVQCSVCSKSCLYLPFPCILNFHCWACGGVHVLSSNCNARESINNVQRRESGQSSLP